jgi:hypothetical protein
VQRVYRFQEGQKCTHPQQAIEINQERQASSPLHGTAIVNQKMCKPSRLKRIGKKEKRKSKTKKQRQEINKNKIQI